MRKTALSLSPLRNALASSIAFACLAALSAGSASAQLLAAQPSELVSGPHTFAGHTPHMVAEGQATFVEHYDSTKMLRLAISLNLPHPAEESKFLEDVQSKKSPVFHHYLTPEEWDARFAPSAADEQAVVDWATSEGFTVTARFPDRLLVDVEAPAGVIERALHLALNSYQLPSTEIGLPGEKGFANDRDPVLPAHLNPIVLSILGLNSFERVRPTISPNSRSVAPDYTPGPARSEPQTAFADAAPKTDAITTQAAATEAGSGAQGSSPSETNGYYPTNMWSTGAYDTNALMRQGHCCNPFNNPNNSPAATSIALATYGDLDFNDIKGYHAGFPYLAYNLSKISIDGGYTCNNTATAVDDNCLEVSLDAEWSLTMANSQSSYANTAKVYVYEGNSYFSSVADVYNQMATDNYARVSSTSWACQEISCWDKNDMSTVDAILAKMAGQGWTLVVSSGDEGSTAGCGSSLALDYPSSDPNMLSIGGTYLSMYYDTNQFISETDWVGGQTQDTATATGSCKNNNGGSTGGFSAVFGVPGYQTGMGFPSRANPDVSLNAIYGQNIYFLGNWQGVGGTSMSAPEVAGFFAQANSYLLSLGNVCNGASCGTLGNANYPMYTEGNSHNADHIPFYDTTSGCSSNDKTTEYNLSAYCAKTGFDEATGWGTFNMLQLAWTMNWETATAVGRPSTAWTGPPTNTWYNTNRNISWSITDNIGGAGGQATGIAGFTQGWDSIPVDSSTQAHGSRDLSPDSFYDGPQFPNGTTGCLSLASGQACSGGVAQGCHTAHVRSWNNMGLTSGDTTYGPICYDTVVPTVSISANASGWTNKPVTVTVSASDPGGSAASGIYRSLYNVDSNYCSPSILACFVYGSPVQVSGQGTHTFTAFSQDNAGNFSPVSNYTVLIDTTAPTTLIGFSGNYVGSSYESAVGITLSAADTGGSGIYSTVYSVDGGRQRVYSSPLSISTSGSHTITFHSTDVAGNVETAHTDTFKIVSPTTTAISVTPTVALVGAPVTLKATVTPSLNGVALTGSVIFTNGYTNLGTVNLSGNTASLTVSNLPVGATSISALYQGATYYLFSVSPHVSGSIVTPLSISPGSLTFSSTPVGTAAAAQGITLHNLGTTPITFTAATTITGPGAASFTRTNVNCASPLAPGASCTNSIVFKPTTSGTLSATITYTDSGSATPQTVSISGSGTSSGPALTISPGSLNFATTPVGASAASQVITLTNNGTTPITFTAATTITGSGAASFNRSNVNCTSPLAAGASCTNTVAFTPTTAGTVSAIVTYTDSGSATPQTVSLTGTGGSSGGTLSISPGSLTFATTPVGTATAYKIITLTNIGTTPITFTAATTITGTGATSFTRANINCSSPLPAGASCTNTVVFKPTTTGLLTATVAYSDSGSAVPQTITITGTGGSSSATLTISPGSLTFGITPLGSPTASQTLTLTNTGTTPISFTAPTTITGVGAPSFTRTNVNCTSPLAAGASCTNTVVFKPTNTGALTATITYSDSGSATPQTVSLTGTGQ